MNARRASSSRASCRRMRSNACASSPTSSRPESTTGSLEVARGDAVGRPLEPPQAPGEERRGGPAGEDGEAERDEARPDEPRPDEVDVLHRRPERRREEQDVAVPVGHRRLGERLAGARDDAPRGCERPRGPERDRVGDDVRGEPRPARVGDDEERRASRRARRGEEDGPARVRRARRVVDEVLVGRPRLGGRDLVGRLGEEREPAVHEPVLERRDEGDPDDAERAGDDDGQREAEPRADAPEQRHRQPRRRYPTPRTVWMSAGSCGSDSIFSRRWRTWTSIVRGSR